MTPMHPSLATGPACDLGALEGIGLADAIAMRVAKAPGGRFWNLQDGEHPRSRTYQELWDRSGRIAAMLTGLALPPSSLIALMIEDTTDYIPAFWACLRSGHVAVPLTSIALEHRLVGHSRSLMDALISAAPEVVIADGSLIAAVPDTVRCIRVAMELSESPDVLAENAPPAEPACMLPTSGSTGLTKLVALSARSILHRCFTTRHDALADEGVYINTFPIDSTTGFRCISLNYREYAQLPIDKLAQAPTSLLSAAEMLRASSFSVTNTLAELIMSAASEAGRTWDLSSLRQVATGSETVLPSTVLRFDEFLRGFGAPRGIIRAGYGMTETGLLVAGADPLCGDLLGLQSASLGIPAPNVTIRVVDGAGAVVPEGTVGEVEVHAPLKMFSFYWGDPEATAAGYTADGWWRTGDRGFLSDGKLALMGRTKDVFIANGRKHALGAIDEAVREGLDAGEAAFACTLPGRDGEAETLGIALVVPPSRYAAAEAIARQAVGRAFGLLIGVVRPLPSSAIPLTPTGKVRRLDLAALLAGPGAVVNDMPAVAESSDSDDFGDWLRQRIARATGTAAAEIDLRTPIVALGLDSLAILGLKGEVTHRFRRGAPPSLVWHQASIADIAAAFPGHSATVGTCESSVPAVRARSAVASRDGLLPLSYGQEYMWRNGRQHDARPHYQRLIQFAVRGPLRLDVLHDTLDEMVRRHEHLRTTFAEVDGVAGQRIHAPSPAEVVFTDLSGHRRPLRSLEAVRQAAKARMLDLESGPLMVAYVTRLGADDHRFDLLIHHVLYDARSFTILLGEIDRIYSALAAGRPSPSGAVQVQMADIAREVRQKLDPQGATFAGEVRWWRDYWLRRAPSRMRFVFARAKPADVVRASDCLLRRQIPKTLHDRLRQVGRERGTSLFVVYCAAAVITLARHSSGSDVVLGTYLSSRDAADAAATIGYMINLVQFHLRIGGALTWADVVERTHDAVVDVTRHRGIPHHLLSDALREGGTPAPTLQAVFQYMHVDHRWTIPELAIEREPEAETRLVHRYLSFNVVDWGDDVFVTLKLNGHRHHTAALAPLMKMFLEDLRSLAQDAPLSTSKMRAPSLLSRAFHAIRAWTFRDSSEGEGNAVDPGAEIDDLRSEIGMLLKVAQERADLIEALHAEAERQRGETSMLRSAAEERAKLIEALHAEAERLRAELASCRSP